MIIKDEEHEYQGEKLNFSLLGVVDVVGALNKHGHAKVFDFLNNKHPAKNGNLKFKPLWVRDIKKDDSGQSLIFAFFVATKEANPNSSRVLISEKSLVEFRNENPIIEIDDSWSNWEEVLIEKNK